MKIVKVFMYKWVYGKCRHFCGFCKYYKECYNTDMFVWLYHQEKAERIRRRDLAYYKKWKEKRGKKNEKL